MAEVRWRKTVGPAEITKLSVGSMDNNVYLIAVGDEVAVVDGGSAELDAVLTELGGRRLVTVLQTHNHGDHVAVLPQLVAETKAPVLAHPADADKIPVATERIDDGATVGLSGCLFKVLHTPGHTPGGVCFLLEEAGESHLFAGDSLFPGGPGNTWGSEENFTRLIGALEEKVFVLPDSTHVYPGHGLDTTIGTERPNLPEWKKRGF